MEEGSKIKLDGLPEMTESEAAQYVLKKISGRDLFPEKTARARKLLKNLEANQQSLLP